MLYNDYMETRETLGFRPNRSCHDALKALNKVLIEGKVNYIVDADIKGFFDNVDHEWMLRFIGHRIADPNIKRLVARLLKAGIIRYADILSADFNIKKKQRNSMKL